MFKTNQTRVKDVQLEVVTPVPAVSITLTLPEAALVRDSLTLTSGAGTSSCEPLNSLWELFLTIKGLPPELTPLKYLSPLCNSKKP